MNKKIGVGLVSVFSLLISAVPLVSFAAISTLNGLTGPTQTFATSTAPTSPHLLIQSSGTTHTFKWDGTPWLVNQGGTGATSFATGSIPFINNGIFSQNNVQLFWDAVNNIFNIGGTTTPSAKLSVKGSGSLYLFNLASSTGTSLFSVSGTGSTTIANGVNITAGCFSINGTCLAASSSNPVASGTEGQFAYYPLTGSTLLGTSTIFISTSGKIGINTTSPLAALDIRGAYYSNLVTASPAIDWSAGNVQSLTLNSNSAITFTTNGRQGGKYDLIIKQDGSGGRTVTSWPASVKWSNSTAPTLTTAASAVDIVSFIYDGTNYYASYTLRYGNPATIAFDMAVNKNSSSGTITLGSLTNGLVMVRADMASGNTCSAISVNGVSGTLLESSSFPGQEIEMWYVPVGTVSGSVSYSATCGGFNILDFASYSGVNQSTPINGHTQATASANSVSSSLTPSVSGTWAVVDTSKNGACAVDSLTNITNRVDTASNNAMRVGDSNGPVTNGVAYTQTVTASGCTQLHLLQQALLAPAI